MALSQVSNKIQATPEAALTSVIPRFEQVSSKERSSWRWSLRTAIIVSNVRGLLSEECGSPFIDVEVCV